MALIGNYSAICKAPIRFLASNNDAGGVASNEFLVRTNWSLSGRQRNVMYREMATTANKLYAEPTGYYPPMTWMIPEINGQMSSHNQIIGSGNITFANLAGGYNIAAGLTGAGNLTANIMSWLQFAANLSGAGSLSATPTPVGVLNCALSGSGMINANIFSFIQAAAALTGNGTLTATGQQAINAAASLSGSGNITNAQLQAIATLAAAMTGSGNITTANLALAIVIVANLSGSGTISNATWTAPGFLTTNLSGNGTITTTETAIGELQANITSFSTLSPQSLADAVWNAVAANYTTPGTMGYIMDNPEILANLIITDPRFLTVAKFLGLK